MRKLFVILLHVLAVCIFFAASAPAIKLTVGPYIALYRPPLTTLNEQVLLFESPSQDALGSAFMYGGELKVTARSGWGCGVCSGYWKKERRFTYPHYYYYPEYRQTDEKRYKVSIIPLDMFAEYAFPLVQNSIEGRVRTSLGMVWGKYGYDLVRFDNIDGCFVNHFFTTAGGRAGTITFMTGIDYTGLLPLVVGFDINYRFAKISQLDIEETNNYNNSQYSTVVLYYKQYTGPFLPLPLELNGFNARLSINIRL